MVGKMSGHICRVHSPVGGIVAVNSVVVAIVAALFIQGKRRAVSNRMSGR